MRKRKGDERGKRWEDHLHTFALMKCLSTRKFTAEFLVYSVGEAMICITSNLQYSFVASLVNVILSRTYVCGIKKR